jgi:hypothetical protein
MARKKQRMLKTLALRPKLPEEVEKQAYHRLRCLRGFAV